MRALLAPTEPFIKLERTRLSADAAAEATQISLENADGLAPGAFLVLGQEGSEKAQLRQVATVDSATEVTLTTPLAVALKAGEPAVRYRFNQRRFYGSDVKDGAYTLLATVDIQVDDPQGSLYEHTGDEYAYFKATYYNSVDGFETAEEDAEAVLADESARYASIHAIRKHAGLQDNPYISDARIETKRRQAESEINSAIYSRYSLPLPEVPPLISQICELLAAGYIDFEEYGADGEGVKWLGEARALLKGIMQGHHLLISGDGAELTRRTHTGRLSGYPDHTIEPGALDDRMFKASDRF